MQARKNRIINYFIILQLVKSNRSKARNIFLKYYDYIDESFEKCSLILSRDITDLYESINEKIIENANSVFDENINGKIMYFKDNDFPHQVFMVDECPIVLFYNGNRELLNEKSISVVGTRHPSETGVRNAQRIANFLAHNNITIVSGLAEGVDYITHDEVAKKGYTKLIAVIGTPLRKYYPKKNIELQNYIREYGLLVTEYAFFENTLKWNFLRRNYVMSAISSATIVIEASDTSGTISQARSTLKNGRPLFVPNNVFINPNNSWPTKFKNDYNLVYKFENYDELLKLILELYKK